MRRAPSLLLLPFLFWTSEQEQGSVVQIRWARRAYRAHGAGFHCSPGRNEGMPVTSRNEVPATAGPGQFISRPHVAIATTKCILDGRLVSASQIAPVLGAFLTPLEPLVQRVGMRWSCQDVAICDSRRVLLIPFPQYLISTAGQVFAAHSVRP